MNNLSPRGLKRIPVGLPGVGWPQLATYPQSPFSGPACCCDVAYLSQAFSQPTGLGAIMNKSERRPCSCRIQANASVIN